MDILITDSVLREFLDTKAVPEKIAECVSLCGPSIEKITKEGKEIVYHVEVTTNRVDAASAYGLAREASAILPRFGIEASLKPFSYKLKANKAELDIDIDINEKLCERFVAVKLANVNVEDSPQFIKDRLTATEQRPVNNIVDITNYVMGLYGIPMHAFDYDKLGKRILVREAKAGEVFVTLDNVSHKARGGEVVFDNGNGEIIDLPGVMGTANSAVSKSTTNVLLVFEHMNPLKVREASLKHELRTQAATLNEKDPDPNEIDQALRLALSYFLTNTKATVDSEVFDWYPAKRDSQSVSITKEKIDKSLGVEISKKEIEKILQSLEFKSKWSDNTLTVTPPTYRAKDISIEEDIIEEIARLYGYFKLPSNLPTGALPGQTRDTIFAFENKIKTLLKGWGGVEVYTLSMVSKSMAGENAPHIKNPLGSDGEYMRTDLVPSLIAAAEDNVQEKNSFHLFEIANVYTANGNKLANEEIHIAGIFANTDYRHAKGILEALFKELNISDMPLLTKEKNYFVYEYKTKWLADRSQPHKPYIEIPKYPPQVEDITIEMNQDTKTGDIIFAIQNSSKYVTQVELVDMYENSYTFRICYQDNSKTLTDTDVKELRNEVTKNLQKIGVSI